MTRKNRGASKFLQSFKWGPFWQQDVEKPQNGATLEFRGLEEAGGAKDKEAGESRERGGREERKKGGGGGNRRQVLISGRLLIMRSLSHCSQIDVM